MTSAIERGEVSEIAGLSLHLKRTIKGLGKVDVDGIRTSEGFVVLQGSYIAIEDDNTIPAVLKEQRAKGNVIDGYCRKTFYFHLRHMLPCL